MATFKSPLWIETRTLILLKSGLFLLSRVIRMLNRMLTRLCLKTTLSIRRRDRRRRTSSGTCAPPPWEQLTRLCLKTILSIGWSRTNSGSMRTVMLRWDQPFSSLFLAVLICSLGSRAIPMYIGLSGTLKALAIRHFAGLKPLSPAERSRFRARWCRQTSSRISAALAEATVMRLTGAPLHPAPTYVIEIVLAIAQDLLIYCLDAVNSLSLSLLSPSVPCPSSLSFLPWTTCDPPKSLFLPDIDYIVVNISDID